MIGAVIAVCVAWAVGVFVGGAINEHVMGPTREAWREQAYDLLTILHRRIEGERRASDEITAIMNDATAGCPACRNELARRVRDAAFAKEGTNAPGGDA